MGAIYQASCSHCGHRSLRTPDTELAVLIDCDHPATKTDLNQLLLVKDIGELTSKENQCLLVLAHPLEDSILRSTGYTFHNLRREGRGVLISHVVCRRCGTEFSRYRLAGFGGGMGCLASLIVGLATGIAAGVSFQSFGIGVALAFTALMTILIAEELLESALLRIRFPQRMHALSRFHYCPKCGSHDAQSVNKMRKVVCPACGERSFRFRFTAMS